MSMQAQSEAPVRRGEIELHDTGIFLRTDQGEFPLQIPEGSPVFLSLLRARDAGCRASWDPKAPAVLLEVPPRGTQKRETSHCFRFEDYLFYDDRKFAAQISEVLPPEKEPLASDGTSKPACVIEYHTKSKPQPVPFLFFDGLNPASLLQYGVNLKLDGAIQTEIITSEGFRRVEIEIAAPVIAIEFSRNPGSQREIFLRAVHQPGTVSSGRCLHEIMSLLSGVIRTEQLPPTEYHQKLAAELG